MNYFFKDRLNVGLISQNIDNLNKEIYSINDQIKFFENKIRSLRSERIKFLKIQLNKI